MPKTRNIIIFVAIAAVFALAYFMFLRPESEETANLVSTPSPQAVTTGGVLPAAGASVPNTPLAANDFLTLLLNVKNIKLEDAIFADPAFQGLRDSSITLEPDGNEGRPNPFAPLGQDITLPSVVVPIPEAEVETGDEEEQMLDLLEGIDLGSEEDTSLEEDPAAGTI